MTAEEFDFADGWEPGYRYELINGVLIVSPPPSEGERGPNEELGTILRLFGRTQPPDGPYNYTLSEHTVDTGVNRRTADRVIWAGLDHFPNVREEQPAIVVEFVSEGRRDRVRDYETKRREYMAAGIGEYWIIDRFTRRMTVVSADGSEDGAERIVAGQETYESPLLPGFVLRVADLLAEADRLRDAQDS
jgi:Uma2 family endonuclease